MTHFDTSYILSRELKSLGKTTHTADLLASEVKPSQTSASTPAVSGAAARQDTTPEEEVLYEVQYQVSVCAGRTLVVPVKAHLLFSNKLDLQCYFYLTVSALP